VYNGEKYVAQSLESLLAQTFTDFELLVVDNASTDRTDEICRSFAARDARVRYVRNERNIGGGPNWNRTFELASPAPYFKWAAHDDLHAPRFLERCIEVLDRDPSVVLAFTEANLIDSDGNIIGSRKLDLPLSAPDRLVRFRSLLDSYDCFEIHGVIRRQALVDLGKPVLGMHLDGDGVLLARLALLGRFHEVDEPLFAYRRHATQTLAQFDNDHQAWVAWWDPATTGRRVLPQWRRQLELWRALAKTPVPPLDRLRGGVALAKWVKWRRRRFILEARAHATSLLRSLGRSSGAD